jgi:hypothetical protein
VYYVVSANGEHIATVEADGPAEAVSAVDVEGEPTVREATRQEVFVYLLNELGMSHRELAERLGTSKGYIGHRTQGTRETRPLDVLAMERLRQLQDEQK